MKGLLERMGRKAIMYFYPKIFGETPGKKAINFIRSLSLIFVGIAISKVFSVLFQIYTGRALGLVEYGKYTLVTSLANFFWIPMVLGLAVALVKYLAEDRGEEEKKKIISTTFSIVLLLILASTLSLLVLAGPIAAVTDATYNYIIGGIVLAISLAIWTMSERVWRGLNKMKKISMVNIFLNSFLLIASIVAFTFFQTAFVPIAVTSLGYLLASTFAFPEMRKYFRPRIDRKWAKILLKYGAIVILSTIPYAINTNINKILINIFFTLSEVGLYQAYSFSSLNVAGFFITTFIIVFFPAASREKDKKGIFKKMNKMLKIYPLVFVAVLALSLIILSLYGSAYSIMLPLVLMFAVAAVIDINFFIHTWFSSSLGLKGVKDTGYATVITAAFGITLAYMLIPAFNIYGAITATTISFIAGTIFIRYRLNRRLK